MCICFKKPKHVNRETTILGTLASVVRISELDGKTYFNLSFRPRCHVTGIRDFFAALEHFRSRYIICGSMDSSNTIHILFYNKEHFTIEQVTEMLEPTQKIL